MTAYTYDALGTVYDTATYDSAAVGALRVELLLNSVWTEVTTYVRIAQGVRITRGVADYQGTPNPATCALTFDNSTGRFTPTYTAGAYYPYLMRNTQLRVSVIDDHGASQVRFWGEVSEWPITFDHSTRNVTVDVIASGPRRRMARAAAYTQSAYKRAELSVAALVAYWPMEDQNGATSFGSGMAGGAPMAFAGGGTLANDSTLIASDPLPSFTGTGNATGIGPSYVPAASGQQVRWLQCKTTDTSTLKTFSMVVDTTGLYFFQYTYQPSTDLEQLLMARYSDGVVVANSAAFAHGGAIATTGARMSMELKQNGANVEMNVTELPVGSAGGSSFGIISTAGTLGRVTGVRMFASNSTVSYTVGHVSIENQITSIFDLGGLFGPLNAWAGENAYTRAVRLAGYEGCPALLTTGASAEPMGPQTKDTFLNSWDETAYVDGGISTESVTDFAVKWRGRSAMYSQAAALTIDVTRLTDIKGVQDDQTTQNDVTVARTGGASARQVAVTGLTPAAVGTYTAAYALSLYADTQCAPQAGWRMIRGSVDATRYPVLACDAITGLTSGLRDNLIAMREGDTIALTATAGTALGLPASQSLRCMGWTETITDAQWLFAINAAPGAPFTEVFVLDSATYGVLDTNRLAL